MQPSLASSKRRPLGRLATLALGALCVLSLSFGAAHAEDELTTAVPSVIGKSEATALAMLAERGLKHEIVHVHDDVAAPGTVIGQDPKSGSELLRGSKIVLRVIEHIIEGGEAPSGGDHGHDGHDHGDGFPDPDVDPLPEDDGADGIATAIMPDLLGRTMADAEMALVDRGLTPRMVIVDAADRAPHTVVSQDKAPNAILEIGTEVLLEISRAVATPTLVRVPYLRGLNEADAAALLGGLGLRTRIVRKISNWPKGRVFTQTPAAGNQVAFDSEILVTVAVKPPTMVRVKVPNLSGMKPHEARTALLLHGLLYRKDRALGPNKNIKRVFKQNRAPNSLVLPGTRVTFYTPTRTKMPGVIGMGRKNARNKILATGLKPTMVGPAPMMITKVISQNPASGTWLAKGSDVTATFKNNMIVLPLTKKVPNVVGMSTTKAKIKMVNTGFKTKFLGAASGIGVRYVTQQFPAAGIKLAIGKTVTMKYKYKLIVLPFKKKVPNVVGKTVNVAKSKMVAAGFKTKFTGPANGLGARIVKQQFPSAGTMLTIGKTVTMAYKYKLIILPMTKKVPNVVGKTVNVAKSKMVAAGFKTKFTGPANGLGARIVKQQFPSAGAMLTIGKTVTMAYKYKLIVLPFKKNVPNVVGKLTSSAFTKLKAAGFKVKFHGPVSGQGKRVVKSQTPGAGSKALVGSTIHVYYKYKLTILTPLPFPKLKKSKIILPKWKLKKLKLGN